MKVIGVLLDKVARRKLTVIELLLNLEPGHYSISPLMESLTLSYPTLIALCNEIKHDFAQLQLPNFLTSDGKINWQPKSYSHNRYRQYLIRHSIAYKLLLTTLIEPEKTLVEFCQENFLSRATLARKLRPFNQFLKTFDLRLNLTQMKLIGQQEGMIRLAYHCYLWISSFGEDLFVHCDLQSEHDLLQKISLTTSSYVNPKEVLLMLLISRLRVQQGYRLNALPFTELALPPIDQTLTEYFADFLTEDEQIKRHTDFFAYFIFYTIYFIDPADQRLSYIQLYFDSLKQTPLHSLHRRLWKTIKETILAAAPSLADQQLLATNLFVTLVNFNVQPGSPPLLLSLLPAEHLDQNPEFQQIQATFAKTITRLSRRKDFAWLKNSGTGLAQALAIITYPYCRSKQVRNVLKVGIVPLPNYLVMQELKYFLTHLEFVDFHLTSAKDETVDLYIATSKTLLPDPNVPHYLVSFESTENFQDELFIKLWEIYQAKYQSKELVSEHE